MLTIFVGGVNLAAQNSASGRHRISRRAAPLATHRSTTQQSAGLYQRPYSSGVCVSMCLGEVPVCILCLAALPPLNSIEKRAREGQGGEVLALCGEFQHTLSLVIGTHPHLAIYRNSTVDDKGKGPTWHLWVVLEDGSRSRTGIIFI